MFAFAEINNRWQAVRGRFPADLQASYFRRDLTAAPVPATEPAPLHAWFRACQLLAAGETEEPDEKLIAQMWDEVAAELDLGASPGGKDLKAAAMLMLACARALKAAGAGSPGDEVWKTLASPAFPLRVVKEIASALRPGAASRAGDGNRRSVLLPVVLVCWDAGLVGTLELELMSGGSGVFYPAAEMTLAAWDGKFASAWESARVFLKKHALWPEGCDIRWRFTFRKSHLLPLRDNSLGAPFAFGGAWLAAKHFLVPPTTAAARLRQIEHPENICFSGALSPEDALIGAVREGVLEKIEAAAGCPHIAFLVLPKTALACVMEHHWPNVSVHSPFTFSGLRGPDAPGLTLFLESSIL